MGRQASLCESVLVLRECLFPALLGAAAEHRCLEAAGMVFVLENSQSRLTFVGCLRDS